MKRSKALNRIGLTIIRFLQEEGFKQSPLALGKMKELSENILTVLEREGMAPPEIPHPDTLLHHPESVYINEWEPEDEA